MKPQYWFCENCRAIGVVMCEERQGAYSVTILIRDQHKEASQLCDSDVRVLCPENQRVGEVLLEGTWNFKPRTFRY